MSDDQAVDIGLDLAEWERWAKEDLSEAVAAGVMKLVAALKASDEFTAQLHHDYAYERGEAERLRADLARVEAERDDAIRGRLHLSHLVDTVSANERRLQARIAEVEGSLRPFAQASKALDEYRYTHSDEHQFVFDSVAEDFQDWPKPDYALTMGELRRARAVLEKATLEKNA